MKKICFLVGNLNHSGGTERVTTLIANVLVKVNHEVFILSISDGKKPFFQLESNIKTYSLYPYKISMKRNFLGAIWGIRKFVNQHDIDTLIVVDSISCIFTIPALYGLKVKHICWEHFNFNNNNGVVFRDWARYWAAKYCDYIVTLTQRDKQLWEKTLKQIKAQLIAIPNPTPYENINNEPSLAYKTILSVGRLTDVKGFDLLIEAWAKANSKLPDWKILIIGTGEDESMLKQMAIDYNVADSVIFKGHQVDMDLYYRQASFFCMSSKFEGFPMVLLEAQSYGLPIVSFDCDTGPAEIVDINSGFLVSTGDTLHLSQMITQMANSTEDRYQHMVKGAFLSSKRFSVKNIILKWKGII